MRLKLTRVRQARVAVGVQAVAMFDRIRIGSTHGIEGPQNAATGRNGTETADGDFAAFRSLAQK
jgi:hypothetical protein